MHNHVLVINRFDDDSGRYHRYIDHRSSRVAYITTPDGRAPLDEALAEIVVTTDDLADFEQVYALARGIADRFGPFDHVLALSEFDLDVGAGLRERLGVPGPGPQEIRRVRDKVTMKTLVAAAGLRVPRFAEVTSYDACRDFAGAIGFPVVLKPRSRWDSQGIFVIDSLPALERAFATQVLADYECEEFIAGEMYQVDGIVHAGTVRILRSSRLLDACLDFALGGPFGSVANGDAALERRLWRYAQRVVTALELDTSAFHLELFRTAPADAGSPAPSEHDDDLVFLEIGARVGGALIPDIWRDVYGVDLHEVSVRLLLGETPDLPAMDVIEEAGGYLLMPEPPVRPCRVVAARSLIADEPAMYAEILPQPGAVLAGTGGCRETGGRYAFRAATSEEIERAIQRVVNRHELRCEPLTPAEIAALEEERSRPDGRLQSMLMQ